MAYASCLAIIDEFITALRTYSGTSSGTLHTAAIRKGPLHTLKLKTATGQNCAVIVQLENLEGGEQGAGSGNHWWHVWALKVLLMVPDDEEAPDTAEDLRCTLLDDFMAFIQEHRCNTAGVKTGKVSAAEFILGSLAAEDQQVWRSVELTVTYKALRS
jgi:hypothetical protein